MFFHLFIRCKMIKVKIEPLSSRRLLYPRPLVLVTSASKDGKPNIITLAWSMPTSFEPPLVAISVAKERFSHELIEDSGEFVVNIPSRKLLGPVLFCGSTSGRFVDKFKEAGLTPLPSERVKPPRIKECVAHLECKLVEKFQTGDHTIFIGEVVASSADEGAFDERLILNLDQVEPLLQVGGDYYVTIGEKFRAK